MSRQEATNTFNDGMIKDMNPLTTPNTVLTDCVNGTLITYNGNEFVLQNDMGNYPLPLAKLGANYIPVGIKEYGNTIYIVSYNPVDKMCQIGSYPSPKRNFGEEHDGDSSDITVIPELNGEVTYTDLNDSLKAYLYSNKDELKLNPGDLYYLYNSEQETLNYTNSWWTVDHYILTEESKLIPIKVDKTKIGTSKRSNIDGDYSVVNWTTVGWMAIKSRIANIEKFDIFVENLTYSPFQLESNSERTTLECDLIFQIVLTDELFNNTEGGFPLWEQLSFKVFKDNDNNTVILSDSNVENSQMTVTAHQIEDAYYGKDFTTQLIGGQNIKFISAKYDAINATVLTYRLHAKVSGEIQSNVLQTTLVFTPILDDLTQNRATTGKIIYDPFKTKLLLSSNNILSSSTINLLDTYKYSISNKDVSINFTINVPLLSTKLSGKYEIYTLDGTPVIESKEIENLQGQNTPTISFDSDFLQNEIYEFRVTIYDGTNKIKTASKPLITCPLFNNFYFTKNDFDQIYWDEWLSMLKDYGPTYSEIKVTKTSTKDDEFQSNESEISYPTEYVVESQPNPKDNTYLSDQIATGTFSLDYDVDTQINIDKFVPKTNIDYQGTLFSQYNLNRELSYSIDNVPKDAIVINSEGIGEIKVTHDIEYIVNFPYTLPSFAKIVPKYLYNYMSGYQNSGNDYGLLVRGATDKIWCAIEKIKKYDSTNPDLWKSPPGLNEKNDSTKTYIERKWEVTNKKMHEANRILDTYLSSYFMFIVLFYPINAIVANVVFRARNDAQWGDKYPQEIPKTGGYGVLVKTENANGKSDYKILLCTNPNSGSTSSTNDNFSFNPTLERDKQLKKINEVFNFIGQHAYVITQGKSSQMYIAYELNKTINNTNNTNKRWTFMSIRHSWDSIEYNQNNILTTEGIKAIVSNSNLSESNNFKPSGVFQQSGKTNITIEKDFEVLVPTDLIVIDLNNANYTKWLESLNTAYTAEANIPANQLAQKDTSNVKWNTIQGDSELNTDANMSRFIEALQYNNQTGKVTVKESSIQGEGETAFWINNDRSRGCWNAIVSGLTLPYLEETNG